MVWELTEDEIITAWIEGITFLIGVFILFVILYIKHRYPKYTKKGFKELFVGYFFYSLHIICDLFDTLVAKKVNDETTTVYLTFDLLDAIFSFIGLFIVGFAFYRIAQYGIELWRNEE